MKIGQMIAAAALLATGTAFAGNVSEYVDTSGFVSTKTRAAVRVELEQARAQGLLHQREHEYPIMAEPDLGARGPAGARASVGAGKTRAEVRKELEATGLLVNQKGYEYGK